MIAVIAAAMTTGMLLNHDSAGGHRTTAAQTDLKSRVGR